MKSIDDKADDKIRIKIDSEWLSYQAMMTEVSGSDISQGLDKIIKYVNDNYDDLVDMGFDVKKSEVIKTIYSYSSDDASIDFIENINKKNKDSLRVDIDSEWFNYHLMISHVFNPKKTIVEHAKNLMGDIHYESEESAINSPEKDKDGLTHETYNLVESNLYLSIRNTELYKKYLRTLDGDIN